MAQPPRKPTGRATHELPLPPGMLIPTNGPAASSTPGTTCPAGYSQNADSAHRMESSASTPGAHVLSLLAVAS